jgi:hypothetical protein
MPTILNVKEEEYILSPLLSFERLKPPLAPSKKSDLRPAEFFKTIQFSNVPSKMESNFSYFNQM